MSESSVVAPIDQVDQDAGELAANERADEATRNSYAMRVACFIGGALGLLASVILIKDPATGFTITAASAGALLLAFHGAGTWEARRELPHILAVVLIGISLAGLCASTCGTYKLYESLPSAVLFGIGAVPTGVLGIAVHVLAITAIFAQRRMRPDQPLIADVISAIAIGGSVFYGGVLILHGSWCGACVAVHALMAVQLVELLVHRVAGVQRVAIIATALAGAGILNAVYHHRDIPVTTNDPDALLAYQRSGWTSPMPPRPIIQDTVEARATSVDISTAASASPVQTAPFTNPPVEEIRRESPRNSSPVAPGPDESRLVGDANRWGSPSARIALIASLNPGCPNCAALFPEILKLRDLVEKQIIQVRFLLCYDHEGGADHAMASFSYAAGLTSDRAMLDTLDAFFRNQGKILTPADAVQVLPVGFPRDRAMSVLKSRQVDISALLADANRRKQSLGSTGDPTIWVQVAGRDKPSRKFEGATMAEVLRVAISSVEP